jgi:GrpB-like predicted nucleotidyltransferase (UPF0157 family)
MRHPMKSRKPILPKPDKVRKVEIAAYDADWVKKFEKEAVNLKKIFGGEFLEIHHIGSTSIPGMDAKPIIDMLLVVREIHKINSFNKEMQLAGYLAKGENSIPGRRFFIKGDELQHTHHLHIYQEGHADIARHIGFRDYLITHPKVANEYSFLKKELANRHPFDIDAYQTGKEEFIRGIDQKVRGRIVEIILDCFLPFLFIFAIIRLRT